MKERKLIYCHLTYEDEEGKKNSIVVNLKSDLIQKIDYDNLKMIYGKVGTSEELYGKLIELLVE